MAKEILERQDIPEEDTWDLESLFPNLQAWEEEYKRARKLADEFIKHQGKFTRDDESLLKALKDRDKLSRIVENIYVYTHMKLDEDTRNSGSQSLSDKGIGLLVQVNEKMAFFEPELLTLEKETMDKYLEKNQDLKLYRHFLEDMMRQKEHVLTAREESILAQMGEVAMSPEKTYSMLNDADIKFPTIQDQDGEDIEITQGNFIPLMESKDRKVRKNAFESLYGVYKGLENTFASTLNGDIKNNIFNARLRNYSSTREASLSKNNIDLSVYDNLIQSVHNNLETMYKYMDIRKRVLELDELHMYDLYTPMVKEVDFDISYDRAVELVKQGLKPLREEYIKGMDQGFNSRWIDKYENRGKRSGAYSSGSYDSKPFILLNYKNTLDNVFTVAHEMGHSMHSYFTRRNQPYVYGDYSIFVAEVASTANEALLLDYMLENTEDKNERLYLLNHYLESFRSTVFRQTMFAEFEKIINEYVEDGGALTSDYLCKTYKKLNELYYGPNMVVDEDIAIEWARIPHFYMNFYVFQYATGFSAAIDLSQQILKEGKPAVDRYLDFLKSGSSDYPVNVLKKAGVDMTTKEPVDNAMKIFGELVDELDKLI